MRHNEKKSLFTKIVLLIFLGMVLNVSVCGGNLPANET